MTKVLIVNCVFEPEPVVSAQIGMNLATKLSSLNYQVTVIAPRPSRPFGFEFETKFTKISEFDLIYLDSYIYPQSGIFGRLRESISFGIASYKYICAHSDNIDIVYMNTWPIFSQLAVALASKKISKPYKIHIQDIYPESITNKLFIPLRYIMFKLLMPIEKYVLKNANKIIVISEKMKKYFMQTRNIKEKKIDVILNWQDDTIFHEYQNNWESGLLTFMYLGNIGPVAGIPFVIEAFAKATLPNAQLIIAGVGSSKNSCIQIAEKYPETSIIFQDVPMGKVPSIQSLAHVMILPITKEAGNTSIPSKLSAYMFSARPIIALAEKGTDIEIIISESKCGWVGEPENEAWLINCFKKVCNIDRLDLIHKGKLAQQYARINFSKENNLNKLIKSIIY